MGGAAVFRGYMRRLDPNPHPVHPAFSDQFNLEMRGKAGKGQHLFFDLAGEDIDAAQDDHVIRSPHQLFDPPHRPRRAGQKPGQIAGAVADDRQCLFGQGG